MKGIAILGSTGTIGEATLDVAGRPPDRFRVVALAAHSNHDALFAQLERHRPAFAALADRAAAAKLTQRVAAAGLPTRVLGGPDALVTVATLPEADAVMAAIVGAAGLAPTLAAASSSCSRTRRRSCSRERCFSTPPGRAVRGSCRSTASTTRSSSACRPEAPRACRRPASPALC